MDNPRPEKVAVVDEVRSKLEGAGATLVTEYRGLNVAATAQLRRTLSEAGGEYKIYKNTLVRFAARDLGLDLGDLLTGPTAIAFVDGDPVAVAKALRDFARNNPALIVKGGLLGKKLLDAEGVRSLADVEPRDILLARLAGAIAAPMQQFAGLLQALPRNLAYGLKALIEQGGAPGAPASPSADASSPETSASEPVPADAPEAAVANQPSDVDDSAEGDAAASDAADGDPAHSADAAASSPSAPTADGGDDAPTGVDASPDGDVSPETETGADASATPSADPAETSAATPQEN